MIEFSDPTVTDTGCEPCASPAPAYEPPPLVPEPAAVTPPPPAPPTLSFGPPPALELGSPAPSPVPVEPAPLAVEPAPLVIQPAAIEAPAAGVPAPGSLVITPEQPAAPSLVIQPDLAGDSSYQPIFPQASWYDVDAALGSVGSGGLPSAGAGTGALIPGGLTADGLWATSDQDRDGIPNSADGAPFTPAPRR